MLNYKTVRNPFTKKLQRVFNEDYIKSIASDKSPFANTWTNATRIEHPNKDIIGYNAETKRLEFYIKAENQWYYGWQGKLNLDPPATAPSIFQDNFEDGWLSENNFVKLMEDDFEEGWQVEHTFTQLFSEDFLVNWFVGNIFTEKFNEDFSGNDWVN